MNNCDMCNNPIGKEHYKISINKKEFIDKINYQIDIGIEVLDSTYNMCEDCRNKLIQTLFKLN